MFDLQTTRNIIPRQQRLDLAVTQVTVSSSFFQWFPRQEAKWNSIATLFKPHGFHYD